MTVTINQRVNYSTLLDKKLEHDALTGLLDLDNQYVGEVNGAGQVKIPKFSVMDGLFDYSRSAGFTAGDLTLAYETVTLDWDRGTSFTIDRVDDADAAMVASANLMDEFFRTKLVPEVDAVRFAAYAGAAISAGNSASGSLDASTIIDAIDAGESSIGQAHDPADAILFISWDAYAALKQAAAPRFQPDGDRERNIERFDGMRVVKVPTARFGATVAKDTTNGGVSVSNAINFLMVVPEAVQQVKKFELPKIFTPDENQTMDAWLFQIRLHHGMWVLDQKVDGVYAHVLSAGGSGGSN